MLAIGTELRVLLCEAEKLRVFGPEAPLSAVAGDDLVLPCFIQPNTSAVDMTVEWLKLEGGASLVHLYKDHEDRYEKQAQTYIGRTSLFKDELQKGNTSLKLSSLRVSDEGEYKCLIEHKSWYDDITVNVVVEGQGSHPVITMESYDKSGGINLVCESRGWNPEPDVLWLDRKGDTLPAEETQIHRETGGFSVKRRITVYDYSDSNRFYCRLLQKHHMIEGEVIINSKVFDVWKSNADAWKWNAGILISACLIALGLIVTAVIRYKREMQQGKKRQCTEFLKKKKYAVDVTLDPDTAHPYLTLSPDRKQVSEVGGQENLDDTPQRFSQNGYVVGNHGFSSGRFYFEVQ
ncbi:butyrophilin subfamily 1 member A1-like isoform X1, partial [Clarias magur]